MQGDDNWLNAHQTFACCASVQGTARLVGRGGHARVHWHGHWFSRAGMDGSFSSGPHPGLISQPCRGGTVQVLHRRKQHLATDHLRLARVVSIAHGTFALKEDISTWSQRLSICLRVNKTQAWTALQISTAMIHAYYQVVQVLLMRCPHPDLSQSARAPLAPACSAQITFKRAVCLRRLLTLWQVAMCETMSMGMSVPITSSSIQKQGHACGLWHCTQHIREILHC